MAPNRSLVAATVAAALALGGTVLAANAGHVGQTHSGLARAGSFALASAQTATFTHRFRGRVTNVNRAHHWFSMRTLSHRSVQIYISHHTYWDDCGWGYMRWGSRVDVRAYRSHHHWLATHMQRWGWMMP